MKLLNQKEAYSLKKRENDALIESNFMLRKKHQDLSAKLFTMKDNYSPDKVKAMQEYEVFCSEINEKKSKMLKELKDIEKYIEEKKDIYYGLIEKQDSLEERLYEMEEKSKKLDLREAFVVDLEDKWKKKQV